MVIATPSRVLARALAGVLLSAGLAGNALAQDVTREITNIAGDLYRFQNNFHFSVFLVTDDGIIVTDPINAEAAAWLKAELSSRFDQPVKFVVYSHDHADHISGGEVFADTAVFIAHENALADIVGENRPTQVPDITFSESMNIELGGKTMELRYVGRNHSDSMVVMRFPEERTLFAVDFIPVKSVAFADFPDSYIEEWFESLEAVEAMDFDVLAPGHGGLGTKADVAAFRGYMESLRDQVVAALRAGKSLEETQASIDLSAWSDWGQFDNWGPQNVAGVYQRLSIKRRGN